MPLIHEFGIIDDIHDKAYENYAPEKYHCISLDDEIILDLIEPLSIVKTYFQRLDRPEYGLAYHGITIIPPASLSSFLDIILSSDAWKQYDELDRLADKIMQAKNEQRYMIHYGI
jgi:hypothetical protein